ncbi:type I-E CRISPR-associated protein Cas7/Cse4/CasC [Nocardiopsis sp. CNT-189]|uniref:type I-E CRISPR-associated protein Cas7/Cse4/CasC n=1 Tax=Nocardiopsis oceanisediminis TaxID=2816862 RepID=UPI003B32E753
MRASYIDVHALQTLPYSNVNRDDLGSPKTVVFGGQERTRISSQSWKRVVRHRVEERLADPAVRTRRLIGAIADELGRRGWSAQTAEEAGRQVVVSAGKGIKVEPKKKGREDEPQDTSVLFYLPQAAIKALADLAAEHEGAIEAEAAKKKPGSKGVLPAEPINEILNGRSATINLFGRMVAELPGTEVDGAVQFAHAFTVQGTSVETDFFTAVDDIPKDDDHGSGHMNVGEFASGTFYRYANVNLAQLLSNLDGDTGVMRELVSQFLRAFIDTVPTGKQNTTAAQTVPDLVHVSLRTDRPMSYAAAFEAPLLSATGFAARAQTRLDDYAGQLSQVWWEDTAIPFHAGVNLDKDLSHLGERVDSYPALIEAALGALGGSGQG